MKVITVVGARPQFIKAAAVSRAMREWNRDHPRSEVEEVIVHTGQHFDHNMSQTFFDELPIPKPRHHLDIHGGGHGQMTGRMLERIEAVLLSEKPDWVLVYGDTNSTLAGALAAVKLHIPVAHVEAGLRSFNMRMPEEVNRILSDRVSSLLLCPTERAVQNLRDEGLTRAVHNIGDVMYDAALFHRDVALRSSRVLEQLDVQPGKYVLSTCHRAENTDDLDRLRGIVQALNQLSERMPVVLPLHPRTRQIMQAAAIRPARGVKVCEPLPFLDMVRLEQSARIVLTDSGGVQKEAYFYGVPCVTMRDETEWVETVETGWNKLAGAESTSILAAVEHFLSRPLPPNLPLYGDGNAGAQVVGLLAAGL